VSEINKGLNEQVEAFRSRPLEEVYPVLWVDAMYEKIRMNGHVVSMAVLIVTGINSSGIREILAVEPMVEESKETYSLICKRLKQRGLKKVWFVVSDAHAGLKAAVTECFLGSSWQRCKVGLLKKSTSDSQTANFPLDCSKNIASGGEYTRISG